MRCPCIPHRRNVRRDLHNLHAMRLAYMFTGSINTLLSAKYHPATELSINSVSYMGCMKASAQVWSVTHSPTTSFLVMFSSWFLNHFNSETKIFLRFSYRASWITLGRVDLLDSSSTIYIIYTGTSFILDFRLRLIGFSYPHLG